MKRLKPIANTSPQREKSLGVLIGCRTTISTGLQGAMEIGEFSNITNWILIVPASLAVPGLVVGGLVPVVIGGNIHDDSMLHFALVLGIPVNCLL